MNLGELKAQAVGLDRAELIEISLPERTNAKNVDNFKAVVNMSTEKVATVVSKKYKLVQHKEVIDSVVEALANLNISCNSDIKNSRNRVFVDIEFSDTKLYVNEGETFVAGVRVINSFDKTTGIGVLPRLVRLACSNGMVVHQAWLKGFHISHSQKFAKDFEGTVQVMLQNMINNNDRLKAMVNDCIVDSVEWELMEKILEGLVPRKKHFEALKELLLKQGHDLLTRWDLYNAFTTYATHGEQIKPSVDQWLQGKAQKILTTELLALVPSEKR